MIYVASPYTNSRREVEQKRFEAARDFTAFHLAKGRPVFSPIVYAHEMATRYDLDTHAAAWQAFNFEMLRRSSALWIVCITGWSESVGVRAEAEFARSAFIPIHYFRPNGEEVFNAWPW